MELGISTGSGLEADLRTAHAHASRRAVTDHILALADQAGYGAALIDAVEQPEQLSRRFAHSLEQPAPLPFFDLILHVTDSKIAVES